MAVATFLVAACNSEATPDTTEWTGTVVRIEVPTSTAPPTTTTTMGPVSTTLAAPFEPTPEMLALVGTYRPSTIFFRLGAHGVISEGHSLNTMFNLGKWRAKGNTLTLFDLDKGWGGCQGAVGSYRYHRGGSQLTLAAIDEPCTVRSSFFSRTFSRVDSPDLGQHPVEQAGEESGGDRNDQGGGESTDHSGVPGPGGDLADALVDLTEGREAGAQVPDPTQITGINGLSQFVGNRRYPKRRPVEHGPLLATTTERYCYP